MNHPVRCVLILFSIATTPYHASAQVTVSFTYDDSAAELINDVRGLSLNFTVDSIGDVTLDATTTSDVADVVTAVDAWDGAVGSISDSSLFSSAFSLAVTSNDENAANPDASGIGLRATDGGHLGVLGLNPGRLDDAGTEELYFTPSGLGSATVFSLEGFSFANSNNSQAGFDVQTEGNLVVSDPNSVIRYDLPPHTAPGTGVDDPTVSAGSIATLGDGLFVGDGLPLTFSNAADAIEQAGAGLASISFDIIPGTPPVPGDLDFDGDLDDDDLAAFSAGWKTDTSALSQDAQFMAGDLNHDGITDLLDWYELRAIVAASESSTSIPEPTSAMIVAAVCAAAATPRRRGARAPRNTP